MEHHFYHGEWSFHQGSCPADCFVSTFLLERKLIISNGAVHDLIHGCLGFDAEISLILIEGLPFFSRRVIDAGLG